MTTVTVTQSPTTVTVTSATTATVMTVSPVASVVNENQATIATTLTQVQSIESPNWIQFNTTGTASTGVGRFWWNDTDGTLDLGLKGGSVVQHIGQGQYIPVKSSTNAGLQKGKVVAFNSSDGQNKLVTYPTAANGDSAETLGIMAETVSGGNKGFCLTFGFLRDIDTNNLVEGEPVWLSGTVAGGLTATKPLAPNRKVLIGYCVRKSATVGSIFVKVDAGSELGGTDSNVQITNPQNGQVLKYYAAGGYWRNENP